MQAQGAIEPLAAPYIHPLFIVLVVILQPMDQFFHLVWERILTGRENTLEPTLIDGPYRVAAVVVVSAHSFHNELSQ